MGQIIEFEPRELTAEDIWNYFSEIVESIEENDDDQNI